MPCLQRGAAFLRPCVGSEQANRPNAGFLAEIGRHCGSDCHHRFSIHGDRWGRLGGRLCGLRLSGFALELRDARLQLRNIASQLLDGLQDAANIVVLSVHE